MVSSSEVIGTVSISLFPGKATPAPPVGSVLGARGVNIKAFCDRFNSETASFDMSLPVTVIVSIYSGNKFDLIYKEPSNADLIRHCLSLQKGSSMPGREIVAAISAAKLRELAVRKAKDMYVFGDIEKAMKTLEGTARSMGISVVHEE